ncbi:MAG TPA: helix-turn-helix domain-containing protein [Naasia sp.]|jgi:transcriptional regulator with XRE-family HTH domain
MDQNTTVGGTGVTLHERVAANLRAEMAAQRKSTLDLARELHVGHRAATRRWNGEQPIGLNELSVIAKWLDVPVSALMAARERLAA